jgi:hypothetical protein
VSSKSIGHHKTETDPEEVDEEPMATVRAQDKQRWVAKKAQRKSFFSTLYWWQYVSDQEVTEKEPTKAQWFSFFLFLFLQTTKLKHSGSLFFSFFFYKPQS